MNDRILDVGFEQDPDGLEEVLEGEGYMHSEAGIFTPKEHERPLVQYKSPAPPLPYWKNIGYNVISSVTITYDMGSIEQAKYLSKLLARRFRGITYYPDLDAYLGWDKI